LIRTTNVELTGDRYKANQLSLAHTNRLLEIFRNFNSFLPLLINTHLEPFYDDAGKFVGSIHLSTNYGIEVVTVNVPFGKEKKVKKELQKERIVPCFVVTGGEGESRKVVGYIACMSGTFLEPYRWFGVIEDDEIILDSFYDEGDKYYDGDVALDTRHLLSTSGDHSLLFFRQSGLSPAEDRESEGPITETIELTSNCSAYEFVTDEDGLWAWSFAMSHAARGGGGRTEWDMQFDGSAIFANFRSVTMQSGSDYASIDERICSAGEGPCLDDAAEWRAAFTLPDPCEYTDGDINSFDRFESEEREEGTFLNGTAHRSLKLNGGIGSSVYLHEVLKESITLHSWLTRGVPTYPGEWGITSEDVEDESTLEFTREMFITVDGAQYSISGVFGWGLSRKYNGRGELDILYHADGGGTTTLSTIISGPQEGSFIDMGLIYTGAGANGFQGSTQYPLQNVGGDYYIDLPDVIGAPDNIDYRIRGHIFLGIVQTTAEVQ
jgi:hypothetical protein